MQGEIMNLPDVVMEVIKTLNDKGHAAYVVGGAVRDCLLGKQPEDYDIATSAQPDEVCELFAHCLLTGVKYGTVTVLYKGRSFEVTTFRHDGRYTDGRRPESIAYTNSLQVDLARRDFTINAMAYHPQEGLIDLFGGQKDLALRLVRCVGDANKRFQEDSLRMLRAIRFATSLQGTLAATTQAAIRDWAKQIRVISAQRIQAEFNKLLLAPQPSRGVALLFATQLIEYLLPELVPTKTIKQDNFPNNKTVLQHLLNVLDLVENKVELKLAALFHDIGKAVIPKTVEQGTGPFYGHEKVSAKITEIIMRRLCYPQKTIAYVRDLVYWHEKIGRSLQPVALKEFIVEVGVHKLADLLALIEANCRAQSFSCDLGYIQQLRRTCNAILASGDPLHIKDLAINGHDLMALGYRGEEIGWALRRLQRHVWQFPQANKHEILRALARKEEH